MPIQMSATRERYPLSPKKIIKKTILSGLSIAILYIILLGIGLLVQTMCNSTNSCFKIPSSWFTWSYIIGFMIVVLNIIWNYVYQTLYFNNYYYDLNDNFIVIRKGVIMPKEISIPYERVQDVYVDQDLWDRIFHLFDVHLSTATWTSGMEAHIDGVEKEASDGLRETLLKTIGEKIHRKPTETIQTSNVPAKS